MNSPVNSCVDFVQVFPTLFAEVFVGRALSAKYTNTRAVLPNLADVTLNEEASNILCEFNGDEEVCIRAVDGWTAWVLFRATDAPHGLVLFLHVFAAVYQLDCVRSRDPILVILSAFAPTTQKRVVEIFWRLRRQRGTRCGFSGRRLVDYPCIAISAAGRDGGDGGVLGLRSGRASSRRPSRRRRCHWGTAKTKEKRRAQTDGGGPS